MGQQLYMITVPGLDVKSDWLAVHDLLLDEFPRVTDVLATTFAETLLIVYRGRDDVDAWLGAVNEAILVRRMRTAKGPARYGVKSLRTTSVSGCSRLIDRSVG